MEPGGRDWQGTLRAMVPRGTPLPDADWVRRHGVIAFVALLHAPAVFIYAIVMHFSVTHAALESMPVLALALLARRQASRLTMESSATLALGIASAALVHLSGGYIEMHFHFFVVVALVTLYQQWGPFLLMIGFVLLHHGIAAAIDPRSVYNHAAAVAHPWSWAAIHAAFISMASASGIANWRLNETARDRAEEYYRQLYEGERALTRRLEEADRVKDELVATISHEFRTPLTTIIGYSHLLRSRPNLPPDEVTDIATRTYLQGMRLHRLVENILNTDTEVSDEVHQACLVQTAIESVLEDARGRPEAPSIRVQATPELTWAMVPTLAEVVISNLVDNAIKFGTPGIPISIRASEVDAGTLVEVENTGPEIAPDVQRKIFEPYTQGDSSNTRAADGVGLGLHIVRRLARACAGRVTVRSEGGVTTFAVWVPGGVSEAKRAERMIVTEVM